MAHIIIVDDERNICISLKMALQAEGHEVETFTDPLVALPKVIAVPPDVLVLNGRMPGLHGIDFFLEYREFSQRPVVILSASADEIEDELERRGMPANGYVGKPFLQRHLCNLIAELVRTFQRQSLPPNGRPRDPLSSRHADCSSFCPDRLIWDVG